MRDKESDEPGFGGSGLGPGWQREAGFTGAEWRKKREAETGRRRRL